jgi:hypothetical protein
MDVAGERPHPHSAGRYQQSIEDLASAIESMELMVFGMGGRELVMHLELRPDGQLDMHGLQEAYQLPVAGALERFTAAEFIERLALLGRNPDLHESVVTFPGDHALEEEN